MQVTDVLKNFDYPSAPSTVQKVAEPRPKRGRYLLILKDGTEVFLEEARAGSVTNPQEVVGNMDAVFGYLQTRPGPLSFPGVFRTTAGSSVYIDDARSCWWSYARTKGENPKICAPFSVAQMGRAVGAFHRMLCDFPVERLYASTPNFHNTPLHFETFGSILKKASVDRLKAASEEIAIVQKQTKTCEALLDIGAPARVTLGNALLGNLLVDTDTLQPKGFAAYDYLMPGIWAFDFGSGVYSSCASFREDEGDLSCVQFKLDEFDTFAREYLAQTRGTLDGAEAVSLCMGAVVMSLESGLRLLMEYLGGDGDARSAREVQSLHRARGQLWLCLQMQQQYGSMVSIVKKHLLYR